MPPKTTSTHTRGLPPTARLTDYSTSPRPRNGTEGSGATGGGVASHPENPPHRWSTTHSTGLGLENPSSEEERPLPPGKPPSGTFPAVPLWLCASVKAPKRSHRTPPLHSPKHAARSALLRARAGARAGARARARKIAAATRKSHYETATLSNRLLIRAHSCPFVVQLNRPPPDGNPDSKFAFPPKRGYTTWIPQGTAGDWLSWLEHYLDMVGVTGSSPVSPITQQNPRKTLGFSRVFSRPDGSKPHLMHHQGYLRVRLRARKVCSEAVAAPRTGHVRPVPLPGAPHPPPAKRPQSLAKSPAAPQSSLHPSPYFANNCWPSRSRSMGSVRLSCC